MASEMAELRERLFKAKEKVAELQATNMEMNSARDVVVASRIAM